MALFAGYNLPNSTQGPCKWFITTVDLQVAVSLRVRSNQLQSIKEFGIRNRRYGFGSIPSMSGNSLPGELHIA